MSQNKKRILVTGGAGYIGSMLIKDALAEGYHVRCLDLLIYGVNPLTPFFRYPHFEFIKGDIRDKVSVERALKNIDYVVHLAAIVGDLPCRAAPKSAVEINFKGTQLLAETAKRLGIKRFIFNSTCSNYGVMNSDDYADENYEFNPVSLYAETKIDCEQFLSSVNSKDFSVTSLRFASGYGISPKTRFDLLINSLAFEAWMHHEITLFSPDMWRPYLHVSDMSSIIRKVLKAPIEKVRGEIFNAGSTSQNYTKREIIKVLQNNMRDLKIKFISAVDDKRNYKVNFNKLERALNFKPLKTIDDGFKELLLAFKQKKLTKNNFELNKLETLEQFFKEKEQSLINRI